MGGDCLIPNIASERGRAANIAKFLDRNIAVTHQQP